MIHVFQSIEREEPIEVDPAPTHAALENGHAAATGNHGNNRPAAARSRLFVSKGNKSGNISASATSMLTFLFKSLWKFNTEVSNFIFAP